MAKKKKEIVPANKPLSSADLDKKVAKGNPSLLFTGEGLGLIARYAYKNDVSIKEKKSPKYLEGIHCPKCHDYLTDDQKSRFAMRQKQIIM